MTRIIIPLFFSLLLFSCNRAGKIPDVSDIKVDLTTQHFEQDFFAIDSANIGQQIEVLRAKYPGFTDDFFGRILFVDPRWPNDSINKYVGNFINSYKKIYDTAEIVFNDFSPYQDGIKKTLQFIKYYFPDYKLPTKLITYIGPLDGYGDALSGDEILVGLHHHLGKNSSAYQSTWFQETYPDYIYKQFEPSYIPINCAKNILNDIYPEKENDDPLVIRMVENGKRLYVLSKLLPHEDEYKLIGYTEQQLKDCYKHEAVIWDMFIQNSLLQVHDPDVIKNYIGDSPKTQELGEGAPGNIGSFAGWQIVKKYMNNNSSISLKQLLNMDAETLFQEAKYKP